MKKNEDNSMNIINKQISDGTFSSVYLIYGTEPYISKQYRDKLIDALIDKNDTMNFTVFKGDNLNTDEITEIVTTLPFFAERRVILIEDSGFFKSGGDALADLVSDIPETSCLIFFESEVDKRNRLYKAVAKSGQALSFDTPDEKTLLVWVKRLFKEENLSIDDSAVYRLLECSEQDMNALYNNAEKVKCYCMEKGHVTSDDVSALCEDHIENKVFDMTDAISQHDKNKAISLYNDLIILNEAAMKILYLISRHYNILSQVKLMLDKNSSYSEIASVVKIPPFTVKKYANQCRNYSYKELLKKADLCQETDYSIKSGAVPDKSAVEMLIISLLN